MKGGLWPSQRKWWDLKNRIAMIIGGYGSGKTVSLCKWIIASALHNAPAWSATVSPNFPMARRTIIPTIRSLLIGKQTLRPELEFEHNKSDKTFTIHLPYRPPATILTLSGDEPDSLKGPNLGTVGLDEPFLQDREVFDQMNARCRDPIAKIHALRGAGTPEDLNWGHSICEGEESDKYDVGVVHMDTRENQTLPESYFKTLEDSYDEQMAEAYIRGRFVSMTKGRVFYGFSTAMRADIQVPIGAEWFAGMDFNVNPMAFVVGWVHGEHIHIVRDFELPNADTASACTEIKKAFPQVSLIYPDPSCRQRQTNASGGQTDYSIIQSYGFIALAPLAHDPVRNTLNSVNSRFAAGHLTISPQCRRLYRYLLDYSHEKMKKQKSMSHMLDALRYAIHYQFPIYRPETIEADLLGA